MTQPCTPCAVAPPSLSSTAAPSAYIGGGGLATSLAYAFPPQAALFRMSSTAAAAARPQAAFPAAATESSVLSAHSTISGSASHIEARDVAVLVRQLAESRYITRRLQQRVQEFETTSAQLATVTSSVEASAMIQDLPQQPASAPIAEEGDQRARREADTAAPLKKSPQRGCSSTVNRKKTETTVKAVEDDVSKQQKSSRAAHPGGVPDVGTRRPSAARSLPTSSLTFASEALSTSLTSSITASYEDDVSPPFSRSSSECSMSASPHNRRRTTSRARAAQAQRRSRLPSRTRTHSVPEVGPRGRTGLALQTYSTAGEGHHDVASPRRSHSGHNCCSHHRHGRHRTHEQHGGRVERNSVGTVALPVRHKGRTASATEGHHHHRHTHRASVTAVGQQRSRSAAAPERRSGWLPPPLPLPSPRSPVKQKNSRRSREDKHQWQTRYYDLLTRFREEKARRDADMADIHEMIELIGWEHDRSFVRKEPHRPPTTEVAAVEVDPPGAQEKGNKVSDSASATPHVVPQDSIALAATQKEDAAPETANPGRVKVEVSVSDCSTFLRGEKSSLAANVPAVAAASTTDPTTDALRYAEALRNEADAWRQRCLALLQQQPELVPPLPSSSANGTEVDDSAVASLPPRRPTSTVGKLPLYAGGKELESHEVDAKASTGIPGLPPVSAGDVESYEVPAGEGHTDDPMRFRNDHSAHEYHVYPPASSPAAANTFCSVMEPPSRADGGPSPRRAVTTKEAILRTEWPYHPYALPCVTSSGGATAATPASASGHALPLSNAAVMRKWEGNRTRQDDEGRSFSQPLSGVSSCLSPSVAKPPLFMNMPGYQPANVARARPGLWPRTGSASPREVRKDWGCPPRDSFDSSPPSALFRPPQLSNAAAAAAASDIVHHPLRRSPALSPEIHHDSQSGGGCSGLAGCDTDTWYNEDQTRSHQSSVPSPSQVPLYSSPTKMPPAALSHFAASPPSILHAMVPSATAAARAVTRAQLERDIRRHDQLLLAIGKLQRTAADRGTRHSP